MDYQRKQACGRRLRPEYLSAVAREHARLAGIAQRAEQERLRDQQPLSPRIKISLPRVRWLERGEP
jgi:hypothetical protein